MIVRGCPDGSGFGTGHPVYRRSQKGCPLEDYFEKNWFDWVQAANKHGFMKQEDVNVNDVYVVGFDDTEQAHRAVDYAANRAKKSGASLHLVFVLEWSPYSFHTPEELAERHKRREEELDRANNLVHPVIQKLKEKGAAQLIIGRTGGSSIAQRLLGGVAITLAQVSPVPLTIVP